jgi:hypothetical protein
MIIVVYALMVKAPSSTDIISHCVIQKVMIRRQEIYRKNLYDKE